MLYVISYVSWIYSTCCMLYVIVKCSIQHVTCQMFYVMRKVLYVICFAPYDVCSYVVFIFLILHALASCYMLYVATCFTFCCSFFLVHASACSCRRGRSRSSCFRNPPYAVSGLGLLFCRPSFSFSILPRQSAGLFLSAASRFALAFCACRGSYRGCSRPLDRSPLVP